MDLTPKEEAISKLIEEAFLFGENPYGNEPRLIILKTRDMIAAGASPNDVSTILEKFEQEDRIESYGMQPTPRVTTTLNIFRKQALNTKDLHFDAKSGKLSYRRKSIPIRKGSNQYYLCEVMFSPERVVGEAVPMSDIQEKIEARSPASKGRATQKAVYPLNEKVKVGLGIEELIVNAGSEHLRINTPAHE